METKETVPLPVAHGQSYRLLLTIPEAAVALGLCRAVVYELLVQGQLRSIKIGRARRIPLGVLEEFVADRLHSA